MGRTQTGVAHLLLQVVVLSMSFVAAANTFAAPATVSTDRTPPVLTITSPANGAMISGSTVTVTGTASDALSGLATLTCNGQAVPVQPDNTFSQGPLALQEGFNTFTFIATDKAGNKSQQALGVTRPCTNLVQDPGFESGVSGFFAQDSSSQVAQTGSSPLEGAHSLLAAINGYGNNLWWEYPVSGKAIRFSVSAHLRSDLASSSSLQFCAFVEYADGAENQNCASVSGSAGDKGIVGGALNLDSTKNLRTVRIRLSQVGSNGVQFTVDSVMACLGLTSTPPPPPPPPPSSTIGVIATPPPNSNGWNNSAVTVTFTCSDGIGTCPAPVTASADGANQVISASAVDKTGRTVTASVTLNIDEGPPIITATPSPGPNSNGWNSTAVTVTFKCSDTGSGVATCPGPITVSAEGAGQIVSAVAVDRAGNTASASAMLQMDATVPALTIASPVNGAVVSSGTITIAGMASDTLSGLASVSCNGQAVTLDAGNGFSHGPLALLDGPNTFTLIATDGAGNTRQQTVSVTRQCTNLVQDPGFESGVSGFYAQAASSSVARTDASPLEGSHSLLFAINGYGDNVWWDYGFAGGTANRFSVNAHLRSEIASSSILKFCAFVDYADGTNDQNCADVTAGVGDKGIVSAVLNLDSTRALQHVSIRLNQLGGDGLQFTMDSVLACLTVVSAPAVGSGGGSSGGSGGGSGGSGGGTGGQAGPSHYAQGYNYADHLAAQRPFISLSYWTQADQSSPAYLALKGSVDQAVSGHPTDYYSAVDSVIMYAISGQAQYIFDAITRVDQQITDAENAIAAGNQPPIAGDSFLEVRTYFDQWAVVYDYGYDRLSDSQRQRWSSLAELTLNNLWTLSDQITWDGIHFFPRNHWAVSDPGDNYYYEFMRATMLWALAGKNMTWFNFLQTQKFGPLVDYFYNLPGGGSREGTGYGVSQRTLFEAYSYWKASTGEDLAAMSSHALDSIDYWIHATVPALDRYAPIGDQSRCSYSWLFDYYKNLVHKAVVLNPGTVQSQRGAWWLQNIWLHPCYATNSVNHLIYAFNYKDDLLAYPDPAAAPTDLVYHASGAGHLFVRSSWDTSASWLSVVAGKYDQSHAHDDQGSFSFFKRDWLAVTSNIWSNSGLEGNRQSGLLGVETHNVIRFVKSGSTIPQNTSTTVESTMSYTNASGLVTVHADLSNAYSLNASDVQSWTRDLEFQGDLLRVHDNCSVAPGIQPVFQLQVPVQPVMQSDGSIVAGALRIVPLEPMHAVFVSMPGINSDFLSGYRVELTTDAGCKFDVELQAH